YRMCFPIFSEYWQGGVGDIVYDPGKYVAGALFDLTDAEMKMLDAKVDPRLGGGKKIGGFKRIQRIVTTIGKNQVTGARVPLSRGQHRKISHPADAVLHGSGDPRRLRQRPVDDVDQLSPELQHAGGQETQAAGVQGYALIPVAWAPRPRCT